VEGVLGGTYCALRFKSTSLLLILPELMKKTMSFTSTFWYEIVYSSDERLIFQFLDTTQDGRARCRLCNGTETFEVFDRAYEDIIPHGENSPGGQ
jgi:hypothetical protein